MNVCGMNDLNISIYTLYTLFVRFYDFSQCCDESLPNCVATKFNGKLHESKSFSAPLSSPISSIVPPLSPYVAPPLR